MLKLKLIDEFWDFYLCKIFYSFEIKNDFSGKNENKCYLVVYNFVVFGGDLGLGWVIGLIVYGWWDLL